MASVAAAVASRGFAFCTAIVLLLSACGPDSDEPLRIAVASNFAKPLAVLADRYESMTGNPISVSAGSSGKLFAQIRNGAPFDILLSADEERPAQLVDAGDAVADSRFTYAVGTLVLWSRDAGRITARHCSLTDLPFAHIAIANPDLAPYGRAARQALEAVGSWTQLRDRMVFGENVGQAFAQVATGNAEAGLLARSYLDELDSNDRGSYCDIDSGLHQAIRQDAVLLQRAAGNSAAISFLQFLKSAAARQIITAAGYGVE